MGVFDRGGFKPASGGRNDSSRSSTSTLTKSDAPISLGPSRAAAERAASQGLIVTRTSGGTFIAQKPVVTSQTLQQQPTEPLKPRVKVQTRASSSDIGSAPGARGLTPEQIIRVNQEVQRRRESQEFQQQLQQPKQPLHVRVDEGFQEALGFLEEKRTKARAALKPKPRERKEIDFFGRKIDVNKRVEFFPGRTALGGVPFSVVATPVAIAGLVPRGIRVAKDPDLTLKGELAAAGRGIASEFKADPASLGERFIGGVLFGKAVSLGVSKLQKPTVRSAGIQHTQAVSSKESLVGGGRQAFIAKRGGVLTKRQQFTGTSDIAFTQEPFKGRVPFKGKFTQSSVIGRTEVIGPKGSISKGIFGTKSISVADKPVKGVSVGVGKASFFDDALRPPKTTKFRSITAPIGKPIQTKGGITTFSRSVVVSKGLDTGVKGRGVSLARSDIFAPSKVGIKVSKAAGAKSAASFTKTVLGDTTTAQIGKVAAKSIARQIPRASSNLVAETLGGGVAVTRTQQRRAQQVVTIQRQRSTQKTLTISKQAQGQTLKQELGLVTKGPVSKQTLSSVSKQLFGTKQIKAVKVGPGTKVKLPGKTITKLRGPPQPPEILLPEPIFQFKTLRKESILKPRKKVKKRSEFEQLNIKTFKLGETLPELAGVKRRNVKKKKKNRKK